MRLRFWRQRDDLACRQVVELVNDYLEGALDPAVAAKFEAHIADCDACATYLEQIRETVTLAGRLEPEALEPAARDAFIEAFRGWQSRRAT